MNKKDYLKKVYLSTHKYIVEVINIFRSDKDLSPIQRWFADNGDKTRRLDYNLDQDSVVFDLGGYEGQFASDIFSRFLCSVYIFEPMSDKIKFIKNRFNKNKSIQIFPFAVSNITKNAKITLNEDSSSIYKTFGKNMTENIQLVDIVDFINKNNIHKIDLMKINIEGSEYDLLDHLIKNDKVKIIDNIQVQFHDIIPMAESRMKKIQNELLKTHDLTWQYYFVWENWKRKKE